MKLFKIFAYILLFLPLSELRGQIVSNRGTDFWVCFPGHAPALDRNNLPLLASMSIFITSPYNSEGKVSCGNWEYEFAVQANKVTEIQVPREVSYLGNGSGVFKSRGIHVKVADGRPGIVVYAHVFAGSRSAATLALPVGALGQKYYAIAYTQQPTGMNQYFSQFNILAVEAETVVKISPPGKASFSVTLDNPGDVYQYQATEDVSATLIEVDQMISPCKKVAVFSGSTAVSIKPQGCIPGINDTYDPLFQQLYPLESWGMTYALIPFYGRKNGSIYRVLAAENNTQVNIHGTIISLNAGEYYTSLPLYQVSELVSNKPVMVTQYALTQYCSDPTNQSQAGAVPGDPDMIVLNPVEYGIRDVTLYSSNKLAVTEQYINVAMPTRGTEMFKINGVNYSGSFLPIPGGGRLSYAQIDLRKIGGNDFDLSADTNFNAFAYGFGPIESYAYSAGTNLAAFISASALKQGTDITVRKGCLSDVFDFQLLLPYQAQKLSWELEESGVATVIENPVAYRIVEVNGRTLYEYRLLNGKKFMSSGFKQMSVKVVPDNSSASCFFRAEETVLFDVEIGKLPRADFQHAEKSCIGSSVLFSYKEEVAEVEEAISWLWDFGDGTLSSERDPVHIYSAAGVYSVKLTVKGRNGCFSEVLEKVIDISQASSLLIQTDTLLCKGQNARFMGQSDITQQGGEVWEWDFGNGDILQGNPVSYIFPAAGTYTVRLNMKQASGCGTSMQKEITVVDVTAAGIEIPAVSCTGTGVLFKAMGTADVIAWQWDFGDGKFSREREPLHAYKDEGVYTVSLMVRKVSGCWSEKVSKSIAIKALPQVSIVAADSSCLNQSIAFGADYTMATVAAGWNWDFGDGSSSREEKPVYSYAVPGEYLVRLRISNPDGCESLLAERKVVVREAPTAGFQVVGSRCAGSSIAFQNTSSGVFDVILSYEWDFGDGSLMFTGKDAQHLYEYPGIYKIRLKVITAGGCSYSIEEDLLITERPLVDFTIPASCADDEVLFEAKTFGGSIQSWEWDFGDGSPPEKGRSTVHRFPSEGEYTVTLKVLSAEGCAYQTEKKVQINGVNPRPNFELLDGDVICGNRSVYFRNLSTVPYGKITRLEWMFDYGKGQQVTLVDTAPEDNKIYEHKYPASGQDQTYQVVLRAYSGTVCYQESSPVNVTVKGVPALFFNVGKPVCINAGPIQLDAGNKVPIAGTEKVEGKGVRDGVFYPEEAGVGNHEITYTFLSSGGCTDTLKRVLQVLDIPELEAYQEFNVLLGGERTLDLKLQKGKGVRYQWYPSEGLSADNILNPVATPKETTKYMLTLSSGDECLVAYEVMVNVHIDPFIPNAFSPNGDGYNDTWSIKYLETFVHADIKIFNRYGQEVFYSKRYTDAWNGKYRGQDVPVGVYYYIIEPNNGRSKYTGSITLIR